MLASVCKIGIIHALGSHVGIYKQHRQGTKKEAKPRAARNSLKAAPSHPLSLWELWEPWPTADCRDVSAWADYFPLLPEERKEA